MRQKPTEEVLPWYPFWEPHDYLAAALAAIKICDPERYAEFMQDVKK